MPSSPKPHRHGHKLHPKRPQNPKTRTLTISRSDRLPQVTILAGNKLAEEHIVEATKETLWHQIMISFIIVFANIVLSGVIFSYLEGWSLSVGFYFSYCAFMTIGTPNLTQAMAITPPKQRLRAPFSSGTFSLPLHHPHTCFQWLGSL